MHGLCKNLVTSVGEHGNVFEFLEWGPEDALIEVHLRVNVLTHLGGYVVALGRVDLC